MSRRRAIVELVAAATIWGFGFIAVRWSLDGLGALWIVALRFLIAFALTAPVLLSIPKARAAMTRRQLLLALVPGLLLCTTLVLQTFGLRYTSATNSGFITCLYVLFVPPLARVVLKEPLSLANAALVAVALVGTALICNVQSLVLNVGDLLTLGCAVAAAGHIIALARIARHLESPLAFNALQSVCAGTVALGFALALEPFPAWPMPAHALVGFGFTVVISTILAFLMQVRAQSVLPAHLASILFLLESPFAAVFAFFLLGERLAPLQWSGAALILAASIGAVRIEARAAAARARKSPVSEAARVSYEPSQ